MGTEMPPWPTVAPSYGAVVLRKYADSDVDLAYELGEDPYIPLIGTLVAHPTEEQGLTWIRDQRQRLAQGKGFSFAVADAQTGRALGAAGLWLHDLAVGRATVGYAVSPKHRGKGVASQALRALVAFAWAIPRLDRIEAYIEPWNRGSVRVAESAGFRLERLMPESREVDGVLTDMLLYSLKR
ncbi:GNAT family N-acetyltransferase [Kibdelosporangium philippinense]|uniref:GNAT family N-acetyltransferase n=1 Tax=Kibdelosporangium philippinense TaxID=211113 RepID=A0ABS8ZSN4_9PSEU|nr:GNAT family N-acetyltransferase [Kibdelosporangium philippinense]MCE7010700.1 GNAT family N-acetyltransferase [Kibdelosporangium philippinense]